MLSVRDALQKTLNQQAAAGVVTWPSNIKSHMIVVVPCHDKGGGCDKLVLKIVNAEKSDSPARSCLIGLFDTDDDGYAMTKIAFLSL